MMADSEDDKTPVPANPYRIDDPERLAANFLRLLDQGAKALRRALDDTKTSGPYSLTSEMTEASKALGEVMGHWLQQPERLARKQTALTRDFVTLWGRTYQRFLGQDVEPVTRPAPGDNRFQHPDWTERPLFDFWKQAYLLASNWAQEMVAETQGVEQRTRRRAQFYLNQITSALSPSNFPVTNPEVLRATLASNAENLVRGMTQLLEDLDSSGDLLKIRQTDLGAFAVGRNLAVTPGKVVYQNDIMQLIQYAPTTERALAVPLLIVPPWINKYYILDLVPQKSLIRWLVGQGFTVFVVSWVNPDARLAHKSFEDYMREGVLDALSAVTRVTGAERINALGYCVGGTLLGATLAYMAATGDERIAAASFLATQVDFSQAGDLMIFIDDAQLAALEQLMAEHGYLDGSRMAAVFNMLRPKDLIWPYVINNYLLGKQPFPFDLLYWNADSTRMPPANHGFYLREFYHHNRLAKGEMVLGGVRLDLGKVTIPIYELATRDDHIAPAPSVFTGARLFGGPVRFVLAGSGHIAGVINPPDKAKYMHWVFEDGDGKAIPNLDDWLTKAQELAGSWWPDYGRWLRGHSGPEVPARQPGDGPLPPIEDAPGSYVKG